MNERQAITSRRPGLLVAGTAPHQPEFVIRSARESPSTANDRQVLRTANFNRHVEALGESASRCEETIEEVSVFAHRLA